MSTTLHEPTLAEDGVLRPTHVTIDRAALAHNLACIRSHVGDAKVMPILKANAYGHGLVETARLFEALGADCLGLAYLEEGIALRRAGITAPILILGGLLGRQIPLFLEHDLILTASSLDKLEAIEACAAERGVTARVHLKFDTGMERIGVHWYNAPALLERSLTCEHVRIEGVYSHFASADEADLDRTRLQLERFLEICRFWEDRGLPVPTRHIANSAGLLQLPECHLDMVRPGILTYGVYPSPFVPKILDVQPALSWTTQVVYFKVVKAGNAVSYGGTWAPQDWTRVVTLPVGYGDGYPRRMSGRADVAIHGKRYPVVGMICMDQILVDIGRDSAYNGDVVTLLGRNGDAHITVEDLAQWTGTIPYEILTGINTRVPRTYIGDFPALVSSG